MRTITGSKWNEHTAPLFLKIKCLRLCDINKYQVCCFMFKVIRGCLPICFDNYFMLNEDIHTYNTRQKQDVHVNQWSTIVRQSSIKCHGPKLWNDLPNSLRNFSSVFTFKRKLKLFLLSAINA